jgi:hypothetical protein
MNLQTLIPENFLTYSVNGFLPISSVDRSNIYLDTGATKNILKPFSLTLDEPVVFTTFELSTGLTLTVSPDFRLKGFNTVCVTDEVESQPAATYDVDDYFFVPWIDYVNTSPKEVINLSKRFSYITLVNNKAYYPNQHLYQISRDLKISYKLLADYFMYESADADPYVKDIEKYIKNTYDLTIPKFIDMLVEGSSNSISNYVVIDANFINYILAAIYYGENTSNLKHTKYDGYTTKCLTFTFDLSNNFETNVKSKLVTFFNKLKIDFIEKVVENSSVLSINCIPMIDLALQIQATAFKDFYNVSKEVLELFFKSFIAFENEREASHTIDIVFNIKSFGYLLKIPTQILENNSQYNIAVLTDSSADVITPNIITDELGYYTRILAVEDTESNIVYDISNNYLMVL